LSKVGPDSALQAWGGACSASSTWSVSRGLSARLVPSRRLFERRETRRHTRLSVFTDLRGHDVVLGKLLGHVTAGLLRAARRFPYSRHCSDNGWSDGSAILENVAGLVNAMFVSVAAAVRVGHQPRVAKSVGGDMFLLLLWSPPSRERMESLPRSAARLQSDAQPVQSRLPLCDQARGSDTILGGTAREPAVAWTFLVWLACCCRTRGGRRPKRPLPLEPGRIVGNRRARLVALSAES